MPIAIRKASRKRVKIKLGLMAAAGFGKTVSALRLAYGICGDWNKIGVIDTENESSELYVGWRAPDNPGFVIGEFLTIPLSPPYHPSNYVEAIRTLVHAGVEVIVIDSASHEWDGYGGCLEIHSSMTGNSYVNWKRVTPLHKAFVDAILQSPVHVITTARTKSDVTLVENEKGKKEPVKVGLKEVQRDGWEYEHTCMFRLHETHLAEATKDRTSLFTGKPPFLITEALGRALIEWANAGDAASFDAEGQQDLYLDTDEHRQILRDLARNEGLDLDDKTVRRWLKSVANACTDRPISEALSVVKQNLPFLKSPAMQAQDYF